MSEENGNGAPSDEAPEERDELLEAIEAARASLGDDEAWQRVEDIASEQQRPDEVAARRGLPVDEFVPKGLLNAYNESTKTPAEAGVGEAGR